ncbi:MAG: 2,3-bisphosphoglycerate-independent phosphoglycerate mutase [Patescibacteria group bacterium]|nr:2,3-bisphosphoglycerate-independent phosphoglycerate mutase [Patescibacteria group bacterium]MDD5294819.1 2,3-bisphosphoglycerate-independent phosphoglycerate mutase [Patescibacteria group bacterium]MDD5554792.1 2,3-bisphosphoglycerate-independent phosphoglycerate mutase [Patescibacteria group bacterium]
MKKEFSKKNNLPMILIILDGWGLAKPNKGNAVTLAETPTMNGISKKYPFTELHAHGRYVGLPPKQDGNSEAGHMNIGAGRVVEQDAVKISKSINDGTFFKNTAFLEAIKHAGANKSKMHLMGMLSNGMSAHSEPDHILALLTLLQKEKINNIYLHLFTDGRDSPKYAALKLIEDMERSFKNREQIATIIGRFYAMDRKKKWERTKMAYDALLLGKGHQAESARAAISESYNKGDNDEFIEPYIINQAGRIEDGDSVIFFNLRSDRARQLAKVFVQKDFNDDNPGSFKRSKVLKNLCFVAMTDFGPDLDSIISAFPSVDLKQTVPMVLSDIKQLYLAETEKYAHVTYFFNGGYSGRVNGEDQAVIASPDVKSYDATPAMESKELAKMIIYDLKKKKYDFTVLNFAAPDMIGHTGNLEAGIKCCHEVDKCLGQIVKAYLEIGGTVIVTADHGNIEEMINLETGEIDTEHSINPVPFIIVNNQYRGAKKIGLREGGVLGDIAPTILELMGRKKPKEMAGESLIK